jgi:hypothetical protein
LLRIIDFILPTQNSIEPIFSTVFSSEISAEEISLNKISEIPPDQLLGTSITGIDVSENGLVAEALHDIARVRLFDRDGNLQNEYGRSGRGPGDNGQIFYATYTDDVMVDKVSCMNEQGRVPGETEIRSDIELLSKKVAIPLMIPDLLFLKRRLHYSPN